MGRRDREFPLNRYTLLFLKWMTDNIPLFSTRNPDQYYVAAWMAGEFEGE